MPAPKAKKRAEDAEAAAAVRLRQQIELRGAAIIDTMITAALEGDVGAARFLLERVMPQAKTAPIGEPVALSGTLADQAETVKRLLSEGRLTLDEAEALTRSIEAASRIQETADLTARLGDLEGRIAALGGNAVPTRRKVIDTTASSPELPAPNGDRDEF